MADLGIIVVGDEILQGRRREGNAAWIARNCRTLGVELSEIRIVSDRIGALSQAIADLAKPDRHVVVTGGLGPTRDDRTRQEVANWLGVPLKEHMVARHAVEQAYSRRGRVFDEAALVQAMVPDGAEMVSNPSGTAPGILVHSLQGVVVCLPGVPSEMQKMWTESVVPLLRKHADPPGVFGFFTNGLGESLQESLMRDVDLEGVEFCSLPGPWGVELQFLVRHGDPELRFKLAQSAGERVAACLSEAVVRPLGADVRQALLEGLRRRNWRLAFAESCTAGLAASTFADMPGASEVLVGGAVAYDNEVKIRMGVPADLLRLHGAVSEEVALHMARRAREIGDGDILGLAVTGIAGPGGGTLEKPVGTVWIAVSAPDGERAVHLKLEGDREQIRLRAAWNLLGLGWKHLSGGSR